MSFSRNFLHIFFILLIILPFFSGFIAIEESNQPIQPISNPNLKTSGEADNIDSFENNPANRWFVTDSGTDDSIVSSQLKLNSTNVNNTGSYFASRRIISRDSKFDLRYKSNITKYDLNDITPDDVYYFDSEFGDEVDFTEDNEGYVYDTSGSCTKTGEGFTGGHYYVDGMAGSQTCFVDSPNTYSIDTSLYDTVVIRMVLEDNGAGDDYSFQLQKQGNINVLSSSVSVTEGSYVTYTLDTELKATWTGTITQLTVAPQALGGFSVEDLQIDYIKVINTNPPVTEFTINSEENITNTEGIVFGLWDNDNSKALMNITQYWFNNTNFRYNVELFDSSSNVVAYFYSDNITNDDVYFRINVQFSSQTSTFSFKISTDGGTRLNTASFPDGFTITGIPQLFAQEKSPYIFFSHYPLSNVSIESHIDFISAKFDEIDWRKTYSASDSDWISEGAMASNVQKTIIDDNSTYRVDVPFLDSFGGKLGINTDNYSIAGFDSFSVIHTLYAVEWDTGNLIKVFSLTLTVDEDYSFYAIGYNDGSTFSSDSTDIKGTRDENPQVSYSVGLLEERSKAELSLSFFGNASKQAIGVNFETFNISSYTTKASQEFVIENAFYVNSLIGTGNVLLFNAGFDFQERFIFEGLSMLGSFFVGGNGDVFSQIVESIFRPFSNLLTLLLRALLFSVFFFFQPFLQRIEDLLAGIGVIIWAIIPSTFFDSIWLAVPVAFFNNFWSAVPALFFTNFWGAVTVGFFQNIWSNISASFFTDLWNGATSVFWGTVTTAFFAVIWDSLTNIILNGIFDDILTWIIVNVNGFWNDVLLPVLTFWFDWSIAIGQGLLNDVLGFLLSLFGLETTYDETALIFDFIITIGLYISFAIIFLGLAVPLIAAGAARDSRDVFSNFWDIHSFDISFGMSALGFQIYIPFVALFLVTVILNGWDSLLLPSVPWK